MGEKGIELFDTIEEGGKEEDDFLYNPEYVEKIEWLYSLRDLSQLMYPDTKSSAPAPIMEYVEAFRYGFKFPEAAHRNFTKSTLTRVLKNFISPGLDHRFVEGNVMFLARFFDLDEVKQQVQNYLSSPYTHKGEYLTFLLEEVRVKSRRLSQVEKEIAGELLSFLNG
jgi:hypothetical protein